MFAVSVAVLPTWSVTTHVKIQLVGESNGSIVTITDAPLFAPKILAFEGEPCCMTNDQLYVKVPTPPVTATVKLTLPLYPATTTFGLTTATRVEA
jgi:hypothetical protein